MTDPLTAPAKVYAPDANRAGPDSPAQLPEWLVHFLALLLHLLLKNLCGARGRRSLRLPARWQDRPDLPPESAQAHAASVRGAFGNSIAWMCLRHGIGPGHADWPDMSRAIVAFGGSIKGFRPGLPAFGLQWWENPGVVPGMIHYARAPAAPVAALLLREAVANALPPAPNVAPMGSVHARLPALHGCPHQSGTFLPVPAPVRRPGRQACPGLPHCHT